MEVSQDTSRFLGLKVGVSRAPGSPSDSVPLVVRRFTSAPLVVRLTLPACPR